MGVVWAVCRKEGERRRTRRRGSKARSKKARRTTESTTDRSPAADPPDPEKPTYSHRHATEGTCRRGTGRRGPSLRSWRRTELHRCRLDPLAPHPHQAPSLTPCLRSARARSTGEPAARLFDTACTWARGVRSSLSRPMRPRRPQADRGASAVRHLCVAHPASPQSSETPVSLSPFGCRRPATPRAASSRPAAPWGRVAAPI